MTPKYIRQNVLVTSIQTFTEWVSSVPEMMVNGDQQHFFYLTSTKDWWIINKANECDLPPKKFKCWLRKGKKTIDVGIDQVQCLGIIF